MMKKIEKIIEYGLYLAVFLLPIQTRLIFRAGELNGGYSEYSTLSLYVIDVLLLALFVLFLAVKIKSKKFFTSLQSKKIWLIIAGLDFWYFVTIFFAINKTVAWQRYAWFLLAVILFWLVVSASYSEKKLLLAFVAGGFLQAGLALWQFLAQSAFAFKWFGLASHSAYELGHSVIETMGGERWLRAYGGLDHPNVLGAYLVVVFLLWLCAYIFYKPKAHQEKFLIYLRPLFVFVIVSGVFFSFSRSAYMAFVFCLALSFFLIQKFIEKKKKLIKFALISFVFFFMLSIIYQDLLFTRFQKDARLEQKSITERVESLIEAKGVIKRNWLKGVGAGNYTLYQHQQNPDFFAWQYQPAHNVWLLIFAELGLIGLVLYISLFFYVLRLIILGQNIENLFFTLPLVALLIFFMFDHWLISLHFGVLVFWLLLGISLRRLSKNS